ncbi:MAG: fumarylacetoacetate hydrolase family protein [Angelakisella sp.]|nr:fumarylacetoacetate hydrolase family protein [Angelakisella sp.]
MRLVMYKFGEREYRLGLFRPDETLVDINYGYEKILADKNTPDSVRMAAVYAPSDSLTFLDGGDRCWEAAKEVDAAGYKLDAVSSCGKRMVFQRDEVKLGAPVMNPRRIICLSHNYYDFCEETGNPIPPEPRIFSKYFNSICGPDDPILYPKQTKCLGYEVELAIVIGKKGRYVPLEKAYDYVAGYTMLNDVSASDLTGMDKQVTRGKTFDNFAPCGPTLVTKDEVPDPHSLDVKLFVNGVELQSSNTNKLIYNVPKLVSFLSEVFTLMPGDIIATGTPGGLAKDRRPTTYMNVGDVCTLKVDILGELTNVIAAESDVSF